MPEQPPNPGATLTNSQATRVDFARRDLDSVRSEDMARLDAASLVLLVEQLRGRLGDMLDLVAEVCDTEVPGK
jgi:hypothetical protein